MEGNVLLEDIETIYDNSVTILYKWANENDLPVILVIARPKNPDVRLTTNAADYDYLTLLQFMTELLDEGSEIDEVRAAVRQYNKFIDDRDLRMVYYQYLLQHPERDLITSMNAAYLALDRSRTDKEHYDSIDSIEIENSQWDRRLREWREKTESRTENINLIQDSLAELEELPPLEFSPFRVTSKIFLFHPTRYGDRITVEDGLDLFNYSVPSMFTPFIRYIDEMGRYYTKIYTGTGIEEQPRYNNIITEGREQARAVFLVTLWLTDPTSSYSEELKYAPKEEFFSVVYYLEQNHLTVEVPIDPDEKRGLITDPELAFQRLSQALPFLSLGAREEIQVKGNFNILDFEIDETLFLDTILIEPVVNSYLYIEESVKPFSLKKRIDLYYHPMMVEDPYRNPSTVSMIVSQRSSGANRYVYVSITQAESEEELSTFFHIFNLLLRFYLQELNKTRASYQRLPELQALTQLSKREREEDPSKSFRRRAKKKIVNLIEKAPHIFNRNYSRSCQSYRQPIVLDPEEVDEWTNTMIQIKNRLEERKVIKFPESEEGLFFGCPDDRFPYPDLTKNRENKSLVPCCFTKPNEEGLYDDYLAGREINFQPGAQGNNLIITNKVLLPGKIGVLPVTVETVLKRYSATAGRLIRYGVSYSPDSLLHCVCVAVDDVNYLRLDEEDRQDYIMRLRQYIALSIDPNLLAQELFDYREEDISDYLDNQESFIDPALYYRAIEEMYGVNLYVFRSTEQETSGEIDIPRHRIFHARPIRRYRPTIIILKNYGSESDALPIPQCELVIDLNSDQRTVTKIFDDDMTVLCHELLTQSMLTLTGYLIENNTFDLHRNLYYHLDHLALVPWTPVAQVVDENGKMRALVFQLDIERGNVQELTLYTIPSQPESLPVTDDLPPIDREVVRTFFPQASAVSVNEEGLVIGVWIKVFDVVLAEYIPVYPGPNDGLVPIASPPPLFNPHSSNVTTRLRKLKRDAKIIIQLIRWLYQIALQRRNTNPEEWLKQYVTIVEPVATDSADYYDFSRLTRKLPQQDWAGTKEAIAALENDQVVPTLFQNGKVVIYGSTLYEKIKAMLYDYDRLTFDAFDRPAVVLDEYYQSTDDFIINPQSKLFTSEADFSSWLQRNRFPESNYPLYRAIMVDSHPVTPYLYRFKNRLLMVQHSQQGDRDSALALAYVWYHYTVNLGYQVKELMHVPAHVVYGLTPDGQLQLLIDESQGQENYLEVVYHGSTDPRTTTAQFPPRRFAALLPLQ